MTHNGWYNDEPQWIVRYSDDTQWIVRYSDDTVDSEV